MNNRETAAFYLQSSFEVRGIVYWYGEGGGNDQEEPLLSMNYFYRNDVTLYRKEYHHHSALFATKFQSRYSDYDELGRLVCKIGYVTHGYLDYYYIYEMRGGNQTIVYGLMMAWDIHCLL